MQLKTFIAIRYSKYELNVMLRVPGSVCALEQLTVDGWIPITFTSRFLNSCGKRYSVNELELLGVVCSVEYFKKYNLGKQIKVITDQRAFLSIYKCESHSIIAFPSKTLSVRKPFK